MRSFIILSVALLAASASTSPVTISLTKIHRTLEGSLHADRARVALLKSRAICGWTTVPATDLGYVRYTTSVGIGSPPTYYNLQVDTGSSNLLCGTGTPYVRTSTSIPTGQTVNITFGSGNFTGPEYLDQVTLAPNLVITNQSIGDALSFSGFNGSDGILGVGPVVLTTQTLESDGNATIPTVMNNLLSQGLIEKQVLGVYFSPSTQENDTNGAITYGGTDPSLYEGEPTYIPLTKTRPAAYYWGINITSATYGSSLIIPTSAAGIVDTGATQVLFAKDFFDTYVNAIPGARWDSGVSLIDIPSNSTSSMQPLNFTIGDEVFTMTVAAQLFPTSESTLLGLGAGKQYGVVGKLDWSSGGGFDFVLGQKFMERYYTVFDTDASRVGFAVTSNTFAE